MKVPMKRNLFIKESPMEQLLETKEMVSFCSQLAFILKSGLPIYDGLSAIYENEPSNTYVKQIMDNLEKDASFEEALRNVKRFDETFIQMVGVGEKSGYLDQVMESNALYYERLERANAKIKETLLYPLMLVFLLCIVMGIVVLFVLPVFQRLLEQMTLILSPFSKTMMMFGQGIGILSFGIFMILIIIGLLWYHKQKTLLHHQLRLPFLKTINQKIALSQMSYALYLLVSSGYRLDDTFESLYTLVQDASLKDKLTQCKQAIAKEETFEDALLKSELFTGLSGKILYAGCKSGNVEQALQKLAILYEEDVDNEITVALNRMEPIIVTCISIFVGLLILSIMFPLISMLSNIG